MHFFPKNKKGDLPDLLILIVTLFILGIGMFVLSFVIPAISQGLEENQLNNSAEGAAAIDTLERYGSEGIQNGFLLLFVGMCFATLISAFFVRTHPAFIFLYILFLGLTIFIGTYLSNGYQVLVENAVFGGLAEETNSINTIFKNLTNIILGIGILSMLIIFGKFSSFGSRAGEGESM